MVLSTSVSSSEHIAFYIAVSIGFNVGEGIESFCRGINANEFPSSTIEPPVSTPVPGGLDNTCKLRNVLMAGAGIVLL
jgi:hypothetical protein